MSTKAKTTLCEKCQQPFRGTKQWDYAARWKHHQTWQEICSAAESGCYMCSWYIRIVRKSSTPRTASKEIRCCGNTSDGGYLVSIGECNIAQFCAYPQFGDRGPGWQRNVINKGENSIAAAIGDWKPPVDFDREQLSSLLSRWQQKCKDHHTACISHARSFRPTRLLRLYSDLPTPLVRLIEGVELQAIGDLTYCTVSHCWGDAKLPKLESTNISQFKCGTAIADLPNSYQEAVAVAICLKISYLWIDSLCILQDSVSDWLHEAGAMCEVYRGAEINIALAAAADGSESALSNRDTSLVRAVSTRALWHDEGATEPDWIVFSLSTGVEDLTESQLMKRAWVVQELQLATRTVVLGADQIYHICRPVMSCETFPGGMPGHMHQFLWFRKLAVVYRYNAWDDLVQTFSKCGITKASDWTMAIAGLARWYAKQLDDEYVAGLWRSLLPCCLLWAVQDDAVTKRAAPYRAPTWSWLSIEGPVCCTSQAEGEQDLCDIISIRVDLIDSRNPYGQIRAGDIILRGYVTPVTLWGKREFAMIGTTDCNTGKIVALTPKRPRIGSRHGSCYLSRDVQTSEHGSDFDDLQLKPDGSIDSLLTIQVGPDVDKVDQLEECSITRYVRAYALPVSQCSLSERGFLCVDGLLLVETQGRSGSFSRIGWFNICAYSDAVDRLTATERCSVRIV